MDEDLQGDKQDRVGWWWVLVAQSGAVRLTVKAKLPGKFKPRAFVDEFQKVANETSRRTVREFKKTHRTWKEQKPTWRREVRVAPAITRWQVDTSHLIYFFLNDGTSVRYAAMTPGFRPKTRVKFIGSTAGEGGFSHLAFNPPPGPKGIDARKWDEAIAKRMGPVIIKGYERAMKAGARRSGHSYG